MSKNSLPICIRNDESIHNHGNLQFLNFFFKKIQMPIRESSPISKDENIGEW